MEEFEFYSKTIDEIRDCDGWQSFHSDFDESHQDQCPIPLGIIDPYTKFSVNDLKNISWIKQKNGKLVSITLNFHINDKINE